MEVMEQETTLQQKHRIGFDFRLLPMDKIQVFFIAGLRISYVVANFTFMVLITFLTDVWQLKLVQAVIITNVQEGAKGIMVIFIAFLADSYLGDSRTLLISAIIYCAGLLMLFFTYPSITDKEIRACRERNVCVEKPIGILFYLALVLVTIGQCGHKNYFKSLKWEEKVRKKQIYYQRNLERKNAFNRKIYDRIKQSHSFITKFCFYLKKRWYEVTGYFIAIFVLPKVIESKQTQLLTRACMLGVSSCLFIAGKLSLYPFEGPKESPLLKVFQVILIAFKKRHYDVSGTVEYSGHDINSVDQNSHISADDHSRNSKPLHASTTEAAKDDSSPLNRERENEISGTNDALGKPGNSETKDHLTDTFGFFNRAALYNPSENLEAEVKNGRLCKVKDVEDAKRFMRASLLSLSFLTYGLIQAVSSTFFVEQLNNMDRDFRSLILPVQVFQGFSKLGESTVSNLCRQKRTKSHPSFHGAIRIGLGLLISCFCFIAAFSIEAKRLQAMKNNKTLTAFWLLPQLILMGAMKALANSGIEDFFGHEMPDSASISYGSILAEAITGIGKLVSILLFAAVNNTTKRRDMVTLVGLEIESTIVDLTSTTLL